MSCKLYINNRNERARLHENDCPRAKAGKGGGANGGYRYFNDYDEAWEWMENELDGYEYGDCHYCNPENG